jgi:uncharacterized protein YjbJ (UPF0337 family)
MILKRIADSVGISVSSLSSSLSTQASHNAKSAKEASIESDKTNNTISTKRALLSPVINSILKCVLDFYGFNDGDVFIRFSKAGLTNQDNLVIQTIRKWREGLISKEQALKELNPDWNQNEINSEMELITKDTIDKLELNLKYKLKEQDEKLSDNKVDEQEGMFEQTNDEVLEKEGISEIKVKKLQ